VKQINPKWRLLWFGGRAALAVLMLPALSHAHVAGSPAGGFTSGFRHPISGLDHVLAMVAVGLWGAQLGNPAIWVLPVAFPMVMALGGMVGLLGIRLPGAEIGVALSAVALGAVVLTEAKPRLELAAVLVAFFAIFHGYAHGTELPQGASGLYYSIGFVIATGSLHAVGIAIGLIHRWPAGKSLLRAAGAIVAVSGFYFLWNALK